MSQQGLERVAKNCTELLVKVEAQRDLLLAAAKLALIQIVNPSMSEWDVVEQRLRQAIAECEKP